MEILPELKKSGVHIKDIDHVLAVIRKIICSGNQRMQIVADFDMTLTRFRDAEGKECDSSYCRFVGTRQDAAFNERALKLKDHYYPIEVHPAMSLSEKIPHMVEWWTKAHDLYVESGFKKVYIKEIVSSSRIHFRDGCDWLFQELHKHDVPLLILSAGIGDVILEVIKQRAVLYNNIHVVSNFMDFDSKGVLKGFKGELIHVFNKSENAVHNSGYFENLVHRDSILLLGDTLGDLRMAEGAPESANLLTIGFLNDKVEERLSKYMDSFDIVLVNDQSMEVPNAIVRQVLEGKVSGQETATGCTN